MARHLARLRIARLLSGAAATLRDNVMVFQVGGRGPLPQEIKLDTRIVAIQLELNFLQRLWKTNLQRSDTEIEVRPPYPAESHGSLHAGNIDEGIATEHVGVRIDARANTNKYFFGGVEDGKPVTIIPTVVR